jgi:hypothetical protein
VVAAEDGDAVAITEFERDEEGDGLDRVVATVDIVAHEEVVGVGGITAYAEELGQVVLRVSLADEDSVTSCTEDSRIDHGYHHRQ